MPRSVGSWPFAASALVVGLALAAGVILWFAVTARPSEFPPRQPADQWAAEGAIFGAGALVFAIVATIIATVAFINSAERPALRLRGLLYDGSGLPVSSTWEQGPLNEWRNALLKVDTEWTLALRLRNDGPVAARFVAVRLAFGTGVFLYGPLEPWRKVASRSIVLDDWHWDETATIVQWEGGADAVVHPSWEYDVPLLRAGLVIIGQQHQKEFDFILQIVADDVPPFTRYCRIKGADWRLAL